MSSYNVGDKFIDSDGHEWKVISKDPPKLKTSPPKLNRKSGGRVDNRKEQFGWTALFHDIFIFRLSISETFDKTGRLVSNEKYLLQHHFLSYHADDRKHLVSILLLRNEILRTSG
ncbi:MAG: hypothetical protein LBV71_08470 [Prevotella sp.]|nr:hypothetical protein [Prevotella sp.]